MSSVGDVVDGLVGPGLRPSDRQYSAMHTYIAVFVLFTACTASEYSEPVNLLMYVAGVSVCPGLRTKGKSQQNNMPEWSEQGCCGGAV
jgi:hypothetical protein